VGAGETASSLTIRATSTYDTTKSGTATITVSATGDVPTVTGVTVNPATATVAKGQTRTFSATVQGTNNPDQGVAWSVTGGGSGTTITNAGVLTVGANETASSLTVRATSAYDTSKSGMASVAVVDDGVVPTVTGVVVNPGGGGVLLGNTQTFTATVLGTGNPSQAVTWSIVGDATDTTISSGGVLTVGLNETASSLIVRATSTYDPGKFGLATVFFYGISHFSIGGSPGIINGTNITVSVPYDTIAELANLTPAITIPFHDTIYPSSGTPQDFTNPVTYILTAGNYVTYTVTVANSNAKITSFSFANPSATGIIDEATKAITVVIPYSPNFPVLNPTISVSPKATVSPASGMPQDFTNPATYTVSAEDGSTATYTVTVTVGGQGNLTLIYPEDPAIGAFPDNIILSKSGAEGKPTIKALSVSGEYNTCRWWVDGSVKGYDKTINLSAADYTIGTHQISVEVTLDGVVYSKSGSFKIES
jgi:hypothetical protein